MYIQISWLPCQISRVKIEDTRFRWLAGVVVRLYGRTKDEPNHQAEFVAKKILRMTRVAGPVKVDRANSKKMGLRNVALKGRNIPAQRQRPGNQDPIATSRPERGK